MNKFVKVLITCILGMSILVGCSNGSVSVLSTKIPVPIEASKCKGKDYHIVAEAFSKAGFNNIYLVEEKKGILDILKKEDSVKTISIGVKDDFIENELFDANEDIYITYYVK